MRICGQDVGRGTFSHRHAVLIDYLNGASFVPLNQLFIGENARPKFEVMKSKLFALGL